MQANHREEIAASVAAQQTLGPAYDQALAEGLVERISEEIDTRIATQMDRRLAAELDEPAAHLPDPHLADPHLACRHVRRAQRQTARAGRPSVMLAIGSLAAACIATAIVLLSGTNQASPDGNIYRSGPGGTAYAVTTVIWIVIGVINVAYARRQP